MMRPTHQFVFNETIRPDPNDSKYPRSVSYMHYRECFIDCSLIEDTSYLFNKCEFNNCIFKLAGEVKLHHCTAFQCTFRTPNGGARLDIHHGLYFSPKFLNDCYLQPGSLFESCAFVNMVTLQHSIEDVKLIYVVGDGKHIRTLKFGEYTISMGPKYMSIGCQCRTYTEWLTMNEDSYYDLDGDEGIAFYRQYGDTIRTILRTLELIPSVTE